MKITKKEVGYIVLTFFLCFGIYRNWENGASLIKTFWNALNPFLVGAGIAYIINLVMYPYETWFERFIKWPFLVRFKRGITMLLAYLTFILVIVWIFSIVIPDLISSLQLLLKVDTDAVSKITSELNDNKVLDRILDIFGQHSDISSTISKYTQQITNQLLSVLTNIVTSVSNIASTIINVFVSFVFSIYVLANKEILIRQAGTLTKVYTGKWASNIFYLTEILHDRFHNFFVGQTVEAIILGTLTAIGMFILGFPYAVTVGVLIAFTALIPIVGAFIGAGVGFILIATESFQSAVFFIIFLVILQQLESNLIYPKVVGNSIGLPGMWVLLAITVGGAVSGISGMLVAVPLAGTLYQVLKDNVRARQKRQEVPTRQVRPPHY
ncbi:AI-2E family transporter [Streptococcus pluranimalium]|uniref:AI-2E family transporter n=1 Tax=Streptococcus pluranimalium TaxID=82348 RepID=UPI0039FDCBCC